MSDVACNGCMACCRDQLVVLTDDDAPNAAIYETREIAGLKVLASKPNGDCIHLGNTGCTIYAHRPAVCRVYDCRKQFKIMSRNERRQFKNSRIWQEARARLDTLDAADLAELTDYRARASAGWNKIAEKSA